MTKNDLEACIGDYRDITLVELRTQILRLNEYSNEDRPIIIHKIRDCYGEIATVFFSINGSPPKGYALLSLLSPDNKYGTLTLYSITGRSRKRFREQVRIPEIESMQDIEEWTSARG